MLEKYLAVSITTLLLIVGGGVVLAVVVPSTAMSSWTIDTGSTLAILALIYTSIAGAQLTEVTGTLLATMAGVSVLLLGVGLLLTLVCMKWLHLGHDQTVPLFFTSSLKNLGIALLIGTAYAGPVGIVAIVSYYVVQQLCGALLADVVT